MSDDTTGGTGGDDITGGGRKRGHLRDGHLRDAEMRDGHLRDGHLRDGHLRDGHLRGAENGRSSEGGEAAVDVNDDPFSVPDLLATDALLDRLGRHEASDADLRDAVARVLDAYALNADPETAGVRPVELPDLGTATAVPAGPTTAPRVLLAHRRTLTRLGRGTAAAAAVLALLGGTAAAAATGAGALGGARGDVAANVSAQLPGWFPDTVFRAFGGTPEERVSRELKQAQQEAREGDEESATARLENLQRQLGEAEVDPGVAATLASQVQDTLDQIAAGALVAVPTPTGSPSGPVSASPGTATSLADVAATATSPDTDDWQIPEKPRTGTGTATGTPTSAPPTAPAQGSGAGGAVATTPGRAPTGPVSAPNVPVVPPVTPSGPVTVPPSDTPTGTPTDTAPTDTTPTDTTPTDTPSTDGPTQTTPTDEPTGTPTDTGSAPVVDPTGVPTTGEPTTDPTGPTSGQTPVETPGETPVPTDPIEVVTPTLPVVVEPSPSAGVEPTPGAGDASVTASAGS